MVRTHFTTFSHSPRHCQSRRYLLCHVHPRQFDLFCLSFLGKVYHGILLRVFLLCRRPSLIIIDNTIAIIIIHPLQLVPSWSSHMEQMGGRNALYDANILSNMGTLQLCQFFDHTCSLEACDTMRGWSGMELLPILSAASNASHSSQQWFQSAQRHKGRIKAKGWLKESSLLWWLLLWPIPFRREYKQINLGLLNRSFLKVFERLSKTKFSFGCWSAKRNAVQFTNHGETYDIRRLVIFRGFIDARNPRKNLNVVDSVYVLLYTTAVEKKVEHPVT